MVQQVSLVSDLTRYITDQIFLAFGLSEKGRARRWLWPIFWPPARLFSELAAKVDREIDEHGFCQAMRRLLPRFIQGLNTRGEENIPSEGPLLVASNHPGTYDSVVISATVERPDLKIVATGIPFLRQLPAARKHLIYATLDPSDRMMAVRSSIRHLQDGGALLIFPTGSIDPDPAILPGASEALKKWSPSLELFLRKVPQTRVLITIVSGVLAPGCFRNPLVRLQKPGIDQRRLAEFLQVMQQMFIPRSFNLIPKVTFSRPYLLEELRRGIGKSAILDSIIEKARQLLVEHCEGSVCQPETL